MQEREKPLTSATITHSWAPWWTTRQVQAFLGQATKVVQARFGDHNLNESEGTISINDSSCVLGLSNLAQTCRLLDPEQWRLTIYNHIARLDDFAPEQLTKRLSNYENVCADLRLRIVGTQHISHIDAVCEPLPLGLFANLSLDLNNACCPIDGSYLKQWQISQKEVLALGLKNTINNEQLVKSVEHETANKFFTFSGDSLFVSGHLLNFAPLLPDVGSWGAVVTVPAAHTIMACPITFDDKFISDSAAMLAATFLEYLTGPNSVSPNALWWRPGHPLEPYARLDTNAFELVAPKVLQDRLQNLNKQD